jgi:hypothetical protein
MPGVDAVFKDVAPFEEIFAGTFFWERFTRAGALVPADLRDLPAFRDFISLPREDAGALF